MSFWMYHNLTKSVYPVPAQTVEEVAVFASKLSYRIYFEAELTTKFARITEWWVHDPGGRWTRFDDRPESLPEGCDLYRREYRDDEIFIIQEGEDS